MKTWYSLVLTMVLVLSLGLAGCSTQSQESVLQDLTDVQQNLKSYESQAMMTVTANNTTQKYFIETWYMTPNYYRISLGNENKEITQVIVRNDEGIFVVSPQLKKSFRFKGDWAENQGHVYLYHAAIDRIMKAPEKEFDTKDGDVLFTMKMEPENPLVAKQRITLKGNMEPKQIALLDKQDNSIVSVDYVSYKSGIEFKKDAFTPEAAMAMAKTDAKPVMAGAKDFGIIEPRYVPAGATLAGPSETQSTVELTYKGTMPFQITEQRPAAKDTKLVSAEVVDLWGHTAVLAGVEGKERSMHWFHNGVEFTLKGQLPTHEMIKVAQSMIGTVGK